MNLRTTFTALTLSLAAAEGFAQTPTPTPAPAGTTATPVVDARAANQEERIEQGVASGTLTPRETRKLEREQKHIAKAEAHAKADGAVTPAERKKLHNMQDKASKDISQQKHDAQTLAPVAAPTK